MRLQLRQIKKQFRQVTRRAARRRMRREIDQYFATGEEPKSELGRAYLAQVRAFNAMADESIGGPDYPHAQKAYQQAQADHKAACREVGL